ncbi:hypothetical protein SAMN05421823_1178 [Catalinimonas alkaloidigena]|uniref:Outer membrane protein beta-barrel domain-containing protein n=1 Tax=Catalinimonas alkaloidigena TaxID=1075417 RepID=A0A1G9ULX3_9BACT|nr:hypothetical protein [Catalinimonas alkaloidigena]SDM60847.1 hypothetical protein SAMN05421823_1178 [Catalinimonas alkaloidigena]
MKHVCSFRMLTRIGFLALFFLSLPLVGQQIVMLKNGSVLHGKVLSTHDEGQLRLRTQDGSLWIFPNDDVASVDADRLRPYASLRGFYHETWIGVQANRRHVAWPATGYEADVQFSIRTFNGYRLHPRFVPGVGIGIDAYPLEALLPLTVGAKGNLWPGRHMLAYSVEVGYGAAAFSNNTETDGFSRDYQGGVLFNPAVSYKVYLGKAALLTRVGFQWQEASLIESGWRYRSEQRMTFRRLQFGIGFSL